MADERPEQQRRRQSPVMIEEEPPHEFYARLFGKKSVVNSALLAVSETRSAVPRRNSFSAASLVEPDQDAPLKKKESDFSRAYHRALSDPPKLSSLALDGTNRGYKLLEKMGWNEQEGGLGRQRQGSMLPVKTVLKRDKKGLGSDKPREARITHSAKPSAGSDKTETKAERRKRRKQEAERESRREKRARMLLRTDLSDEYEQLYLKLHSA